MRRRYGWVSNRVIAAFTQADAVGHLQEGVDPARIASQFIALWDGLQIQWLLKVNNVNIADGLQYFIDLHLVRPLADLMLETAAHP